MDDAPHDQGIPDPSEGKRRCPRHPHAGWVRFDPSGQAWCDRMDCWNSYRLMKIGEALGYQCLRSISGTAESIEEGIEAWSSFVASQSPFAVVAATQQAISLCQKLEVEIPDLSGEVRHLVPA